ncbi:TonB-dependent receptor domain-containing protein [Archangium sp.]|uniref:TonB-dependent receptor n=1 Tax=Archangium sp. TaxID=1872627 RepID=UPI00286A3943|nr:TonB-dependent receptor [Archangium sp.]
MNPSFRAVLVTTGVVLCAHSRLAAAQPPASDADSSKPVDVTSPPMPAPETDAGDTAAAPAEPPRREEEGATRSTLITARRPYTAASSSVVRNADFASRPIGDPSDILEVTPGLFTVQHAGGGKANQFFLRGFDLDHGTDLALSVDGLPVNMVSHGHGQGYSDLHFVIPEVVERLEVTKGPYSAEHGDFATAGAVELHTRKHLGRNEVSLSGGSFSTWRGLVLLAPEPVGALSGYFAGEVYGTHGPFIAPEKTRRYNLFARATYAFSPRTDLTLQLQAYGAGWNASGQIPLRSVSAGDLERFGSVDPTEGGASERRSVRLSLEQREVLGGDLRLQAYLLHYRLGIFSNFTFFANDPELGDQIEQTDRRMVSGLRGRYERSFALGGFRSKASFGVQARIDSIDNGLFSTSARERLASRVDAHVEEGALGAFTEVDTEWRPWLRTVLGLRADAFSFDVKHRPLFPSGELLEPGTERTFAVSPKASLVLTPLPALDVYLNYGRGFHSNDARAVTRAAAAATPLARATGYEVGARTRLGPLDVAAAAWALDLDSELVWVGDDGTTEERGATRRRGLELEVRYRLTSWLRADGDVTYSRARFVESTGAGVLVPLAPAFTYAAGLSAQHPSGVFGSVRVRGLSDRPAIEDGSIMAEGFSLVDLQAGYETKRYRMALDVRNLFNTRWRQAQFVNTSRLKDEVEPVEDLHFTPGYPFALQATGTLFF